MDLVLALVPGPLPTREQRRNAHKEQVSSPSCLCPRDRTDSWQRVVSQLAHCRLHTFQAKSELMSPCDIGCLTLAGPLSRIC